MKSLKHIICIIVCFGLSCFSYCQNLVSNWSFEDTLSCPDNAGQINRTIGWNSCTQFGTPDYYNDCSASYGTTNIIGNQQANTGVAYAGLISFFWNGANFLSGVEYLQSRLTDSLQSGKKYDVSFYVSLADSVVYNCNNLGIYFSADSIYNTTDVLLSFSPQVTNNLSNSLVDKNGWTLISGSFMASGGEKYIIIGNFTPIMNVDTSYVGSGNEALIKSYYYIDDVSVIMDTTVGIGELPILNYKFNLYPNPSNGNMTLNYNLETDETGEIVIYNATGKEMNRYILKNTDKQLLIDNQQLSTGVYFYKIAVNGIPVKLDKLIISK